MRVYDYLADTVVVIHASYIGFVILGLLAILLGVMLRWKWVRNFWFRMIHFVMIGVVVAQALLGIICPLTTLEKHLRLKGGGEVYSGSFVGHWVHELMFYQGPQWVFTVCYCLFGAVVLATLILSRPNRPRAGRRGKRSGSDNGPDEPNS